MNFKRFYVEYEGIVNCRWNNNVEMNYRFIDNAFFSPWLNFWIADDRQLYLEFKSFEFYRL